MDNNLLASSRKVKYTWFRTDNAIKNHFYSTIRRSLRRISKILGSKNSTKTMRDIKPSTLSLIFSIVTGKESKAISYFRKW